MEAETLLRYGNYTLKDLVLLVKGNRDKFPLGMDTQITLGDTEGNYYHKKFAVEYNGRPSPVLKLLFELYD